MLQKDLNNLIEAKNSYDKFTPIELHGENIDAYAICVVIHVAYVRIREIEIKSKYNQYHKRIKCTKEITRHKYLT